MRDMSRRYEILHSCVRACVSVCVWVCVSVCRTWGARRPRAVAERGGGEEPDACVRRSPGSDAAHALTVSLSRSLAALAPPRSHENVTAVDIWITPSLVFSFPSFFLSFFLSLIQQHQNPKRQCSRRKFDEIGSNLCRIFRRRTFFFGNKMVFYLFHDEMNFRIIIIINKKRNLLRPTDTQFLIFCKSYSTYDLISYTYQKYTDIFRYVRSSI